jgi:hypothetical protein
VPRRNAEQAAGAGVHAPEILGLCKRTDRRATGRKSARHQASTGSAERLRAVASATVVRAISRFAVR